MNINLTSWSVSITCTQHLRFLKCCNHIMMMWKYNQSSFGFMTSLSFDWKTQNRTNKYHPYMQVGCSWWSFQLCNEPKDGHNKSNATWWWRGILSYVKVVRDANKCKTIGSKKRKEVMHWQHQLESVIQQETTFWMCFMFAACLM